MIHFAVSGVDTYFFIPLLAAAVISALTSMAGISGAFLLLPFQISVLGFTTPSVSATNLLFNVIGTPGGFSQYIRERRMIWPLACSLVAGTVPGVLAGYYCRVLFLPDARSFKLFVGIVLLGIGCHMALKRHKRNAAASAACGPVEHLRLSWRCADFSFRGNDYRFNPFVLWALGVVVGVVAGAYGIGGGALLAPLCVAVVGLPVHCVAGAILLANFFTSAAGLAFYSLLSGPGGQPAPPDWLLGFCLGIGGIIGMNVGARLQKYVPERFIHAVLTTIVLVIGGIYTIRFF